MRIVVNAVAGAAMACLMFGGAAAQETVRSHGWAIHGDLKYPADFQHFDYADPNAPKGGEVVLGVPGTFDSLHPYIVRGNAAGAVQSIYDTLMHSSRDEPSSKYGLLADWVEVHKDADGVIDAVTFHLREEARFHDGEPVRADDVIWSFNTLREQGAPLYRFYYADVAEVTAPDELTVRFDIAPGENREMPNILGDLPVFPKHYWEGRDFDKSTLEPPLGSGPYRVVEVDAGQSLVLERVPDYWGADLPVNRGHYNFERLRFEYFRDRVVMLEALKSGDLDIRAENSAKNWATGYDVPAVEEGRIVKREFEHQRVAPMQAFVINMRRPILQDVRVREALTYLWDFEWVNRNIMFDAYNRTDSFFDNSELSATGLPDEKELAVLEPLRDQLPARVFTETYVPPSTDGSGNNRASLRQALTLLQEAGWAVQEGVLTHVETGRVFDLEILLNQDLLTPHTQALVRGIERLGGTATIRVVDAAQYSERLNQFDFDLTVSGWAQSLSPGNEQREYWGSAAAERQGSRNLAGIQNPAIDALIEKLIESPDRETLIERTHALDRVLKFTFPGIPMYHATTDRYAYWDRFGIPDTIPKLGVTIDVWWVDPEKDAALARAGRD
jgi:microcin C transport system substrate-binding protein